VGRAVAEGGSEVRRADGSVESFRWKVEVTGHHVGEKIEPQPHVNAVGRSWCQCTACQFGWTTWSAWGVTHG
jgi:hypothetical protein